MSIATTTITASSVVTCADPVVEHAERYGYLFGYPIAHSMSPLMHNTIFEHLHQPWTYQMLPSTDLQHFLELVKSPRCFGSAVTMPHKIAILPFLDDITPEARAVGACNTIFKRDSKLIGTNTDIVGISESFFQNVSDHATCFQGRPGLVVGGGGAARSAVYALVKLMGVSTVYLVNRDEGEVRAVVDWCRAQGYGEGLVHVQTASQVDTLEGPGAIVACVPNYPPVTPAELEARRVYETFLAKPHKGAILEMCYHPTPYTEIGNLAEKAGWQVVLGTEAMIWQGFVQSSLWTGKAMLDLPVDAVKRAVANELSKSRL